MGLADHKVPKRWIIRSDFETVQRAMQRASDRQRALAAHNSLLFDPRLQSCLTEVTKIERLEDRVLGHGEDEGSGKPYMLIEGTDHKVHFLYHSPQIEKARHNGELRRNAFVRFVRRHDGHTSTQDFGDANRLLRNEQYFRRRAQSVIGRGILPTETGVGGWLGQYETALAHAGKPDKPTPEQRAIHKGPRRGR